MTRWRPYGLIGVVHIPPMPGDPAYESLSFQQAFEHSWADARALSDGGADALILENFGSAPFRKGTTGDRIPPHEAALITRLADRCVHELDLKVGINCLRNDAITAIGIAAATGADFIRVNIHTGAAVTDQGIIEGEAHRTLRYRQEIEADWVAILADVFVKHAAPLVRRDVSSVVGDTLVRGHADAVIVTGQATGAPVDRDMLQQVHAAAGGAPVLIGSGMSPELAPSVAEYIDGAIVGTWLKHGGELRNPVDPERVKRMKAAM